MKANMKAGRARPEIVTFPLSLSLVFPSCLLLFWRI